MSTNKLILGGIVAVLLLIAGSGAALRSDANLGHSVYDAQRFVGDVYQGLNEALMMQDGEFVGPIDTDQLVDLGATTTVARSYDGFMAGGTVSSVATGSVKTLYTHSGGRAVCDASQSALYANSTAFSPNLTISVGTSTSAAYSSNLIASSSLATTTDSVSTGGAHQWVMDAGDKITAFLADTTGPMSSSTYFANWTIEFKTHCWLIGG